MNIAERDVDGCAFVAYTQLLKFAAASANGVLLCEHQIVLIFANTANRKTNVLVQKVFPEPKTPCTKAARLPKAPCKVTCKKKAKVT